MMKFDRRGVLASGGLWLLCGPAFAAQRTLEVAYINANVWTGDPRLPRTDAIGTAGNRIMALGREAVNAACSPGTRVIDLEGAFLCPGLMDNHTHFLIGSTTLGQPDLLGATTRADFAARLGAAARANPGTWILGGSWDEQRLGGDLPTRAWIDAATGDTPVAIPRTDLHMLLLNTAALKRAGIDRNTPDIAGGMIGRDARGEPTGILKDNAKALVERVIPEPSDRERETIMRAGIAHGLSNGFTQVHCPNPFDWITYETARRLRARGETDMRFYCMVPARDWRRMADIVKTEGRGDDWVRWGAVKALADGSLGSRTALFHEAYSDAPDQVGVRVTGLAELAEQIEGADKAGLQLAIHAIGDRSNDDVLDIIADISARTPRRDRRTRIEHAQHLTSFAIPRFAKLGVIASCQPYHAIDDGRWAVKRIGEARLEGTYALHSLIAAGATVTFGSDWPVAPFDAMAGIQAAVTRETIDGRNPDGWLPDQKIAAEQALRCYTRNNAFAGFQEDRLGVLAPGYLADLTVLDADVTRIETSRIRDVRPLRTVVDGKTRWQA